MTQLKWKSTEYSKTILCTYGYRIYKCLSHHMHDCFIHLLRAVFCRTWSIL